MTDWRAAIGCFSCRGVCKSAVFVKHGNNYGFDVVIVTCSLLCLALILLCSGDVERNPGPGGLSGHVLSVHVWFIQESLCVSVVLVLNQSLIYKALYLNQR